MHLVCISLCCCQDHIPQSLHLGLHWRDGSPPRPRLQEPHALAQGSPEKKTYFRGIHHLFNTYYQLKIVTIQHLYWMIDQKTKLEKITEKTPYSHLYQSVAGVSLSTCLSGRPLTFSRKKPSARLKISTEPSARAKATLSCRGCKARARTAEGMYSQNWTRCTLNSPMVEQH